MTQHIVADAAGDSSLEPDSPCVGRCSTAYGDEICRGCGRTFYEVTHWIIFDDSEKAAVWDRLQKAGLCAGKKKQNASG